MYERKSLLYHLIQFLTTAPVFVSAPVILFLVRVLSQRELLEELTNSVKNLFHHLLPKKEKGTDELEKPKTFLEWWKEVFFHSINPTRKEFYISLFVLFSLFYIFVSKKGFGFTREEILGPIFATINKQTEYIVKLSEDSVNRVSKFGAEFQKKYVDSTEKTEQKVVNLEKENKELTNKITNEKVYSAELFSNLKSCTHEAAEKEMELQLANNRFQNALERGNHMKKLITNTEPGNEKGLVLGNNLQKQLNEIESRPEILKKPELEQIQKTYETRWKVTSPEEKEKRKK